MRGYTLLELLVVLVLLSLVTGLIMPRLTTLYESAVRAYQLQDVLQQIAGLGYQAYQQGKSYRLGAPKLPDQTDSLSLTLPEDWQVSAEPAIEYYANGVCTGGIITLQHATFSQQWQLNPPLCQPSAYVAQ